MKKLAALLMLLLLSACSHKPTDELITQQVTAQLQQRHGEMLFEVVNFRKVNGIQRGDNAYDADIEYDLRFLLDLKDVSMRLQQQGGSIFAAGMEATSLGLLYGNFQKGDIIHKSERVRFVRSEKGWLIDEPQGR